MRVEDEAETSARPSEARGDVEALRDEGVPLRREAVLLEPAEHELAGGTLAAGWAVDVPQGQREIDNFPGIDARDDVIGVHPRLASRDGTPKRAASDADSRTRTATTTAACALARSMTAARTTGPTNAPRSAENR